jgi:hypothetical protein
MLTDSQLALVTLAGQALVEAVGTDQWETVSRGYTELLGRGDARRTRLAGQRLDDTREQLTGAAGADAVLTRAALAVRWSGRLADLLDGYPDAEADLDALVREIRATRAADVAPGHGRATLDEESTKTLGAQADHAVRSGDAGNAAVARDELAALLPAVEQLFGAEHPDTLATRSERAYWTGQAGDAAAARDQLAALVPVVERVFGAEHADALAVRASLAYWTGRAGDQDAARDELAALLPVVEQVLGPEHPDTRATRDILAQLADG